MFVEAFRWLDGRMKDFNLSSGSEDLEAKSTALVEDQMNSFVVFLPSRASSVGHHGH
jgi:hypothetical protein